MERSGLTPAVNIYEGNGHLGVAVPVPGAHRDSTQVLVRPDLIEIRAECKYPQESQHYHRHEWQVGALHVEVPLPRRVDPGPAHARLSLGVLVVMAPLSESGAGESRPAVE